MLSVDRQKEILDQLFRVGSVKVSQLSQKYGVREETIRRDLKALAGKWYITLVYGGACINNSGTTPNIHNGVKELALTAKRNTNYEAKQVIAKKAASLVEPGDTIGLNSGSTPEYILDYIGDKTPLSIVTLNVYIAAKASLIPNVQVYLPGGKVRTRSGMIVGPGSAEFIRSFTIDKCFFGTSAISISGGIMHPVLAEVESNVAMREVSGKCYVVSDSSKIDKRSLFRMLPIHEVDAFIVDDDFPEEYRQYMALQNIEVI